MLIALAFAHFSSELLLKEQMIIPVKKTLNNAGHIDAKLIDFSEICQKNPAKSAVFYWLFLGEVSPLTLPVKSADFSANLPLKIPRNFVFFLRNTRSPEKIKAVFTSWQTERMIRCSVKCQLQTKPKTKQCADDELKKKLLERNLTPNLTPCSSVFIFF